MFGMFGGGMFGIFGGGMFGENGFNTCIGIGDGVPGTHPEGRAGGTPGARGCGGMTLVNGALGGSKPERIAASLASYSLTLVSIIA